MYQAELIFDQELTPKAGAKIPVGIHSNCSVVKIEEGKTDKNSFVDIIFESDGRQLNKRLWKPKGQYPEPGESVADAIIREEKLNLTHLIKLLHIFLGRDSLKGISGDYDSMVTKISKQLSSVLSTKTVNLKVIYDSKGQYSDLGKYCDYVEEYVEGQEPTLKFTEYESKNRVTPKPAVVQTPLASPPQLDINKIF